MDMREKAVKFEKHMEDFVRDYCEKENTEFHFNQRGIPAPSPYESKFSNLEKKSVETFVEKELGNSYSLFDKMMFEWVRLYNEKNRNSGSPEKYRDEIFNQQEDIVKRECYSKYPLVKPNFFLNNFGRRFKGSEVWTRIAKKDHNNEIVVGHSFSHAIKRVLFYDLNTLTRKLKIDQEGLIKKCTEYGTWVPSDEKSRDQTAQLYLELRKSGFTQYDIWA